MKLFTVYLSRKSGRGRWEATLVEAETPADARKAAEKENPGWIAQGVKEEETCE